MFGLVSEKDYLALEEENEQLREENNSLRKQVADLRWQRGGDSNAVLSEVSADLTRNFSNEFIEAGKLRGKVETLTADRDYWKRRALVSERNYETLKYGKPQEPEKDEKSQTQDNDFENRKDGLTTKEVQRAAYRMKVDLLEKGYTKDQIYDEINKKFDISSAEVYCSNGKKSYKTMKVKLYKNSNGHITAKDFPLSEVDDDGFLESDNWWRVDWHKMDRNTWETVRKYHTAAIADA